MSSEFEKALAAMVGRTYAGNEVDAHSSERMLRQADVIWAVWEGEGDLLHARVILGRDLHGPDLVHVAYWVQDEDEAVQEQEVMGDPIEVDDDSILQAPEPAVPEHMPALLIRSFDTSRRHL